MENLSNSIKSLMNRFFSKFPPVSLIGLLVGGVGGWVYYIEIGCASGTCPLTSNPYTSILWGGIIGYLVGDLFRNKQKAETKPKE